MVPELAVAVAVMVLDDPFAIAAPAVSDEMLTVGAVERQ